MGDFIFYEIITTYIKDKKIGSPINYMIFYPLNISLFYINAFWVMPMAWGRPKKPMVISILIMAMECAAYLAIKALIDYSLECVNGTKHNELIAPNVYYVGNLWRSMSFFAISAVYWSKKKNERYYKGVVAANRRKMAFDLRNTQLERDNAEIQNAFLQQQIHPHFLFNALNFIYSSFYKLSDTAAECVGKLTDIFRYSIYGPGANGKVYLRDEIEQMENFIAINRLRFGYPIYIDFVVKGAIGDHQIIPLVLLSFIENIFKYGTIKESLWPVRIVIELKDPNELIFTCINLKNNRLPDPEKNKTIGLDNTTKRLKYSYPNKYQLSVKDEEDTFGIELQIYL